MTINWAEIPEQQMRNFKGGDGIAWVRMFNDGMNRILMLRMLPGSSIGKHTHDTNSEIMHVLRGTARVIMDGQIEYVHAGQTHYCPKGHTHMTEPFGMEELCLVAVVPEQ
ncbi:MAG: cupin domain-containing protein [Clostridia bacterium]|nr:cupin domain-containing protein [Clostridia bacterium]